MTSDVRVFKVKSGYYIKDFNHEDMDNIIFSPTGFVGHAYNFNNYTHDYDDDDYDIITGAIKHYASGMISSEVGCEFNHLGKGFKEIRIVWRDNN